MPSVAHILTEYPDTVFCRGTVLQTHARLFPNSRMLYGVFAQYRFRCVLGELGRFREGTGSREPVPGWTVSGNPVLGTRAGYWEGSGFRRFRSQGSESHSVSKVYFCTLKVYSGTLKLHFCALKVCWCTLKVYFCTLKEYFCTLKVYFCTLKVYICTYFCTLKVRFWTLKVYFCTLQVYFVLCHYAWARKKW